MEENKMGQFSWFTQDTDERIINGNPMHVVMSDDKGNQYVEECYEGYGVFGGKDFYELLAEMNGHTLEEFDGDAEKLRIKGIEMAFDGYPHGDNPNLKWPSLTTRGWYCNGECPKSDPDQGFPMEDYEDENDEFNEDW